MNFKIVDCHLKDDVIRLFQKPHFQIQMVYLGGLCELDGGGAAVGLCLAAEDGHTRVHQMLPTRQAPAGHDRLTRTNFQVQKLSSTGWSIYTQQVMTKKGGGSLYTRVKRLT